MPTRLGRYCEAVIEAGWLGAIILVPLFFNVYSARVFEPDKLTLLRSLALVMIVAWLVKIIDSGGWRSWGERDEPIWRFPLVLPVGILAAVYAITTLTSITPRVSLVGSYQRLQGTYTTLSYLVVFGMMLMHLRSKAQVDRLVTTAIITSVPISLYGLMQKYGLDPLPWGGDVTKRIASNMGNAIFISAYIIMVTPLTLSRVVESFTAILTENQLSWTDVIRASIYIFVAAIHVLVILFSQSRGPLLGFLAGTFTFVLILLVRLRDSDPARGPLRARELLMGFGSVLAADLTGFGLVYLFGRAATGQWWISIDPATYGTAAHLSGQAFFSALLGAIGSVGGALGGVAVIFVLATTRKGWRWLWMSWILQAAVVGGFLVVFNLPNSPLSDWRELPYIGRIGRALDVESKTGKVRTYIWQGVVEMLSPHEPLGFPDGRRDPFHAIRPVVGYGPESMYVAYNRFYQPELAHVEKRNASPDRSHNETFDALVITGLSGFLAWQALYGSLFYLGFRWLGVIRSRLDKVVFFGTVLGSGLLGAVVFWRWLGPEFIGVAFPFGEVAGLMLYLAYYALLSSAGDELPRNPHTVLLTALLAAAVAHFAEIHFGIAIAATRTYFFAYAALAVILGYVLPRLGPSQPTQALEQQDEKQQLDAPSRRPRKRRRPARAFAARGAGWVRPALAGGLLMGLVLGTLGYEFIAGPPQPDLQNLPTRSQLVWDSLTKNLQKDGRTTYAPLALCALTTVLGGVLAVAEARKSTDSGGVRGRELKWLLVYVGTAVAIGLIFMTSQAGRLRYLSMGAGALPEQTTLERVRIGTDTTAALLTAFYLFAFLVLLCLAAVLAEGRPSSRASGQATAWLALLVGVIAAAALIDTTNLKVIRADMIYKQTDLWDKRAMRERNPAAWEVAVAEYNHALELTPLEDYYYLFLGRAYLEQSSALTGDPVAQQQLMEVAKEKLLLARRINPLNTDHSANLARLHTRWAETAPSDVERTAKANQANEYYEQAHGLSPRNAVIINEWAMLIFGLFGDCDRALAKLDESVALDPKFATTYVNQGNVALTCGDRADEEQARRAYHEQAEAAYRQSLELQRCNLEVYTAMGYVQSKLGRNDEAIKANLDGLACIANPSSPRTLQFHRNLAILYQQQGDLENAIIYGRSAARTAGDNVPSLLDVGRVLLSLGAVEDAYQAAQRVAALAPQSWSQLRDVALLFTQTGHPAEAVQHAQQALQLAPDGEHQSLEELIANLQGQANQ